MEPQSNNHISAQEILFFRPLDLLMNPLKQQRNQYFCELFQRKKKIIDLMQQGKLNSESYLKFVKKAYKNQLLKIYAQTDLLDFKQLYFQDLDQWFQAKVNQTGAYYQKQQQKYNKIQFINNQNIKNQHKQNSSYKNQNSQNSSYKNQNKQLQSSSYSNNNDIVNNKQNKEQMQPIQVNLNVNEISNLKVIDYYMHKYEQTCYKTIFMQLFDRKSKILKLIQNGSLRFDKYIQFSHKTINQTKSQDLKKHLKLDIQIINDLFQGNTKKWFDQMLIQTKIDFEGQNKIYQKHQKGIIVKKLDDQMDLQLDEGQRQEDRLIQSSQCYSFSVLDQFMDKNDENPNIYVELFMKKKQMLRLFQRGEINAKTYKQMLQKAIKKTQRDNVKVYYEMDIQNINLLYNGDLKKWFQFIIDQTKSANMLQDYKFQQFKQIVKTLPKSNKKQSTKQQQQKIYKKLQKKSNSTKQQINYPSISFKIEQMYNLKIIDTAIFTYETNNQIFIKLFKQKNKIIQMMQNGELDADTYKKLQQKMLQKLQDNSQLKDQIQFDLGSIKDLHNNDIIEWFKDVVQNTGANYEYQREKYDNLIVTKVSNLQNICTESSKVEIIDIPQASEIISFTAINKGFRVFVNNSQMINILTQKREKFIDWIKTQKLNGAKYKILSEKIFNSTSNNWIKQNIQEQFLQLKQQFNDDLQKWFIKLGYLLKQIPTTSLINQEKKSSSLKNINQSSTKSKINYFLLEMAVYQSLCKYFKNHKLNPSKNDSVKLYLTIARKQIDQNILNIKNNPNFDVYSYCKKFLPPLNQNIFQQNSQQYKNKLKQYSKLFKAEIVNLTEYGKKLKKIINTQNLQKNKKKIQQCNQNIKYLSSLQNTEALIPLPLIQEQKVTLPHIDEFTNLEHDQLQIKIIRMQNLCESCIMKVYYLGNKVKQEKIQNQNYHNTMKIRLSDKDMQNIMKGQSNLISINLSQKGWFSTTQIGTQYFDTQFIRSNIYQGSVNIGGIKISYQGRVRMAKRPMTTEITQYKLIKYPVYQHSEQVQKQFISKYLSSNKKK